MLGYQRRLLARPQFSELSRKAQELGIEINVTRRVYFVPPPNVWRHLNAIPNSGVNIKIECFMDFVLELLKAIYGLVDAPLLWQLALCHLLQKVLGGHVSKFDTNFLWWTENGQLTLETSIHVDDLILTGLVT